MKKKHKLRPLIRELIKVKQASDAEMGKLWMKMMEVVQDEEKEAS